MVCICLRCRPASSYETATTRQFYNGRTETVRGCTMEVINWVKVMLDTTTTVGDGTSLATCMILLLMASVISRLSALKVATNGIGNFGVRW